MEHIHVRISIKFGVRTTLLKDVKVSLTGCWVSQLLNFNAIFGACLLWVVVETANVN